ncbi:MAG: TetR/AcrR family transcriptional regulator [Anaerolineae bacterium]|nr:TetR/AcrR family transcriptional regulator [Anaerolineae bacterium]
MPRPDMRLERIPQILQAAALILSQRGFEHIRMDDIAEAAGVSKGTLYLYFKSKDEVLTALMMMFFSTDLERLQALVNSPEPGATRLRLYLQELVDYFNGLGEMQRVIYEFYAASTRQDDRRQILVGYFDQYRQVTATIIQQGIDRGEFRPTDAQAAATTLIALIEGLALLNLVNPSQVNLGQQAEASLQLVMTGLLPTQPTQSKEMS